MRKYSVLLLLLILSSCGYQLKSKVNLDAEFDRTFLQHAISAPLYRPLAVALSNQGVKLVDDAAEASAKIVIIKDNLSKQIQSIGTNNRVQEYRLDYELSFAVEFLDQIKIAERSLTLSRDYSFDIGQISGTQAEEKVLREQMYQDMAQMIIRAIANQK
ncbi:LPS assembly lipoprotein LptE [Marinicella litoralis]|uniref:LPS-assembly lipoprotein LptE n=1 Tax=Marinicella litoralis TaxID=644220 RepID=A0A4R6XGK1_9GAMM|nr:LPS assembly lipoprotein LptE [Marinicella litoralis]TDR16874.1 outer membrane lipopolysaccharide assembly protein LptE/RlpB [Marinicella litoralis]